MRTTDEARGMMQYLANGYAAGGFGSHKTWTFGEGSEFPELLANHLIERTGIGRAAPYRFTDLGHAWAMEHYVLTT